ncbi:MULTISPECIES: CDP-glucose 4,6-dehydratase [unclassified Prochlorococcus]|uniref:CDP-glucose 4,6-dehydratase n=1 Tax=unclassified Prochlorococcus TaxID=2627481 RepID=UPI0005338790|nr:MULTISPECIES: CDP-glucose 4,6-dehydratase [unclassified Prochlorococcus]KGG16340.1 CDP-glucose 4,6-dehydratase [Prochlorococcus sp. MIT 0603]KGG17926.1 CDP-glucose 4,6-dehydratase [Prochlorococcus sp. MIT 0602]
MNNKNFWKQKRVLITGHTGFKGSWLSLWLKEFGSEVCGLSLEPLTQPNLFTKLNLHKILDKHCIVDINNLSKVEDTFNSFQPEIIFHLAAQPLVKKSYLEPVYTWKTNVMGTINILESLKKIKGKCAIVIVTTDKVYQNNEWQYGYRENDPLGGYDPYSSSKAAAEIAISSWRSSFFTKANSPNFNHAIASARAGNVIGGGDWSENRILPDAIKALANGAVIKVRNPASKRPWQHVLEPLSGYISLAEKLFSSEGLNNKYNSAYNFGPNQESNRSVKDLVECVLSYWPGQWEDISTINQEHEAKNLNLQIDKAFQDLNWKPKWTFEEAIKKTIYWHQSFSENPLLAKDLCISDLNDYLSD